MATREKQIEEMARIMCQRPKVEQIECSKCNSHPYCRHYAKAEAIYNAGYRKVTLCDECYLQGGCIIEDTFNTARMGDSMKFCAVGKSKNGRREE